jgi:endo-1,4-beta-xylanase
MKTVAWHHAKQALRTAIAGFSCFAILTIASVPTGAQTPPSLKDAFKDSFLVGAAINRAQIFEEDTRGAAIVKAQFNTISPENILKWEVVHPKLDTYDFSAADKYVAFGEKNHMYIVGHTLVWHDQTPKWVFEDEKGNPVSRDVLLTRMREHIQTVVGRYKGRINSWDVVNEALNDDGTLRESPWMKIIGEDYIAKAFHFAHEADPAAQLNYNDYNLENEARLKGALELLRKLQAQGVPVTSVGIQGHWHIDSPSNEQVDAAITALGKLGVKVMITELDIDVLPHATYNQGADVTLNVEAQAKLNPYKDGLPDSMQQALAKRYADLFTVFLKHRGTLTRVTFWCVTDADSWLNNWPVLGRTSYPLLFDRMGQPKPAFDAVIRVASEKEVAPK